jgi:hypothetical protein
MCSRKIADMGYTATLLDQDTHLFYWAGRTASLSEGGYQINKINGTKAFVVNNAASNYRFQNNDSGLNTSLRGLYNRRARAGGQDQVIVLLSNWEDFGSNWPTPTPTTGTCAGWRTTRGSRSCRWRTC